MEPTTLCILTFPQYFADGRIHFNILIIPRNLNPLLPIKAGQPAFADAKLEFKIMAIDSLDGLPISTNVSSSPAITLVNPVIPTRNVWQALKAQMEASDGMKIDDTETQKPAQRAQADVDKYKERSIRKYLPESYRTAFNFVKAKTRYALTGDEYSCAVKNKNQPSTDVSTNRNTLSWGKVVAFCLRNPKLAEKAGLLYKASIQVSDPKLFQKGGWIYTELTAGSDFASISKMRYAARIPALKGLVKRNLFAAVQFPVYDVAQNNLGYDEILRDAIIYDDGFAKVVHANQPVNQDLLQEKDNSNPPLKDIGIRLGWDDEQIAIWYNRQMLQKEEQSGMVVDAPLGVFGYRLDARKKGTETWLSQNSLRVEIPTALSGGTIQISSAGDLLEPGIEVHPAAHGDSKGDGFWLPMYFSSWAGKPITLADKDAEDINMLKNDKVIAPRPDVPTNTVNSIPKKVVHPYRADPKYVLPLQYGEDYEFRVRLMDISGGGPKAEDPALNGGENPIASLHFKRYVAAAALNITNVSAIYNKLSSGTTAKPLKDTSILENLIRDADTVLKIKRPLLGYPAVVFTGKYTNPIERLKSILGTLPGGAKKGIDIGLSDPDVDFFKVRVEAKSLDMDNGRSEDGKDAYILLYEKEYAFASAADNYDQEFPLKIVYQDQAVIDLINGFNDTGSVTELVLPTSRTLRLTFVPLIKSANNDYADLAVAEGKKIVLSSFKAARNETGLLSEIDGGFKAVYLQPENLVDQHKVITTSKFLEINLMTSSTPAEISRLADAFNLSAHNLTIEGEKGMRVQFGCSKLMRHSLAPDSSSVTFSSLSEVFNHWIVGVNFSLKRDWTWNGMEPESIVIGRKWRRENEVYPPDVPYPIVGTINVSGTASMNALSQPDRSHSRLIFFDAFDPKLAATDFPSEVIMSYEIKVKFKSPTAGFDVITKDIHLPVTIIPRQVPKLISAGIALSPYEADPDKYTSTEIRQRFLWLEMDAPPEDPNDTYFARVLSNAPDPLICKVSKELLSYDPVDPPLNINAEKIRSIIPGIENDFAGMGAMQEMLRGDDESGLSNFYMLPLPPGLHADSDELFGFFSYEIRVGHKKELWSTAQGRYGRPLKANGVQHPAPALSCNVFRRKIPLISKAAPKVLVNSRAEAVRLKKIPLITETLTKITYRNEIVITAPFATAVLNGQNISAMPPQTSLWYMLYTQVKQADGKSYRNLLISSGYMPYVAPKREVLQKGQLAMQDEGTRSGIAVLQVEDVETRLKEMGLPTTMSLSVLCVEMFPMENKWQIDRGGRDFRGTEAERAAVAEPLNPLTTGLGSYRIYRTSSLVPVADVCCDDC
jgi:hypothetical protein